MGCAVRAALTYGRHAGTLAAGTAGDCQVGNLCVSGVQAVCKLQRPRHHNPEANTFNFKMTDNCVHSLTGCHRLKKALKWTIKKRDKHMERESQH